MNEPGQFNHQFKAHCPRCGESSFWVYTKDPHEIVCMTPLQGTAKYCNTVHRLASTETELSDQGFKRLLADLDDKLLDKKCRIRELVHDLVRNPDFLKDYVIGDLVSVAEKIDAEIEALK